MRLRFNCAGPSPSPRRLGRSVWRMASSVTTRRVSGSPESPESLVANGDTIRIDRLSGATPNSGTIAATGEVRLDPAAGFPGSIRVTGRHAQVVANAIVAATADLALTLSGRLAQKPNVDGRITIVSMDITVPERFSSVSAPIPGTKHVNPTPTARARLAEIARAKAARGSSALVRCDAQHNDFGGQPHFRPRPRHLCGSGGKSACGRLGARSPGERRLRPVAGLAHADRPAARLHPGASPVPWRRDP